MRLLSQLLLASSTLIAVSVFGMHVGLEQKSARFGNAQLFNLGDGTRITIATSTTSSASPDLSSSLSSDPLTLFVKGAYKVVTGFFSDLGKSVTSAVTSSEHSAEVISLRHQNRQMFVACGALGLACFVMWWSEVGGSLLRRSGNDGNNAAQQSGFSRGAGQGNSIFGRSPPANYAVQSIAPTAAPNDNISQQQQPPICIVCMRFPRDTVIEPCSHMVMCWQCAQLLEQHSRLQGGNVVKCPCCRAQVERFDFVIMA